MNLEGPKRYVPLWERFHVPSWAETFLNNDADIGPHDVPVAGGISGTLDIELEAITPLFVGASQTGGQKESKLKSWLMADGKPAIAGTSIKGALRSVLETATFGRFQDRIDDRRLSIRDLQNRDDYINHLTDMFRPLSRAGWLTLNGNDWTLQPCSWSLVRQTDLERYHNGNIYLGKRQGAVDKYKRWGWDNRKVSFTPLPISKDGAYADGRELSRIADLGNGRNTGTIVLTGQPNDRKRNRKAKSTEFIFHGREGDPFDIPRQVRIDFEQIHRLPDGAPNEEWGAWRKRAQRGEAVPVFWLEDDAGGIRAIGLAMMFRLAYRKTLHEAAKQDHREPNFKDQNDATKRPKVDWDFADLLFGRVLPEEDGADAKTYNLRGRANFSLFTQSNSTPLMPEQKEILLAPKYGFYPALIRQDHIAKANPPTVTRYTTLQDDEARLRGPSRYLASRGTHIPQKTTNMPTTDAVYTRFRPLGEGAKFTGKLRFFNLKPEELGALVWCLHWGNAEPSAKHAHMIGAAKSFGFGACRLSIRPGTSVVLKNEDYAERTGDQAKKVLFDALTAFTTHMENEARTDLGLKTPWHESPQIRELVKSADLDHGEALRKDGKLTPLNDPRDFVQAKRDKAALPLPSGGYEVEPQRSAPPAGRSGRPRQQTPAQQPQGFRKGTRWYYTEEGEEVEVIEDARAGAAFVRIRFDDGDTAEVPPERLAKL